MKNIKKLHTVSLVLKNLNLLAAKRELFQTYRICLNGIYVGSCLTIVWIIQTFLPPPRGAGIVSPSELR